MQEATRPDKEHNCCSIRGPMQMLSWRAGLTDYKMQASPMYIFVFLLVNLNKCFVLDLNNALWSNLKKKQYFVINTTTIPVWNTKQQLIKFWSSKKQSTPPKGVYPYKQHVPWGRATSLYNQYFFLFVLDSPPHESMHAPCHHFDNIKTMLGTQFFFEQKETN